MQWTLAIAAGLVGLVGGSLVPRIAYRMSVPLDEPCLTGCGECGHAFRTGIVGWVHIGSQCPNCSIRLGPRGWITASVAAIASAGAAAALGWSPLTPLLVAVILVGVLLGAIDLACTRLPDVLVIPTFAVSAAALGIIAIAEHDSGPFVRGLLAAAAVGGAYLILAVITGGGFGLGDAKLGLVLGLLLGWFGWPFVIAGVLVAHLMHGLVAVAALLARRAGAGTLIPMGPALLAGAWCAIAVIPVVLLPRG